MKIFFLIFLKIETEIFNHINTGFFMMTIDSSLSLQKRHALKTDMKKEKKSTNCLL